MTAPRKTVAVVGAGAAGLTAALRAAERGARVIVLNAHPRIGLKILMSGGTRCNVTHREVTERDFFGGSRAVVRRILAEFTVPETLAWFEAMGVALKLEETGKYFPVTDDAQTVLDALLAACAKAGVEIRAGRRVTRLETQDAPGAPRFSLGVERIHDSAELGASVAPSARTAWTLPAREPDERLYADAAVLAAGGLSFPRTGSDGTGYALAIALGHTLVPPVPALAPFASSDTLCAKGQGLTVEAELSLRVGDKVIATARGSLLIAHFGWTGPAALDLSRHWHRSESAARRVTASFVPGHTREGLLRDWFDHVASEPQRTVRRHLRSWLPEQLAHELSWEAEVDPARPIAQVSKVRRDALFSRLLERDLHVTGALGFEKAEVTAGGVALAEVDPRTLESRKCPGLYLCGEILDVEGRLGGFNFQWSWSSGTVAGRAAAKK